jgi:hypothetical protein
MGRYSQPQMVDSLKDHVLTEFPGTDRIRHFRLAAPEGHKYQGYYWVHIMFTPIGIVIGGDLLGRGAVGAGGKGYGVEWFVRQSDEHYLCSKFFGEVWQPEAAVRSVRRIAKDYKDGEWDPSNLTGIPDIFAWRDAKWRSFMRIADDVEGLVIEDVNDFVRTVQSEGWSCDGGEIPGYDFPLSDAGWLVAIQQRFSQEYVRLHPAPAEAPTEASK